MKKLLGSLVFFSLLTPVRAQNLVPNGSFEEYTTCPDNLNQISRAVGWSAVRLSPDYLNSCSQGGLTSVPQNFVTYQYPSSGNAYAGGYTWCEDFPNGREMLGAALVQPLSVGIPVFISFRASPATSGLQENYRWSAWGFGVRFSMTGDQQTWDMPLPNNSALHMDFAPTDTSNWYFVSGWYVPDSAYAFVEVGNFYDDNYAQLTEINQNGTYPCSYMLVDDICVSEDSTICQIGTTIAQQTSTHGTHVYPNPASAECLVVLPEEMERTQRFALKNSLGQEVLHLTVAAGSDRLVFSVEGLSAGQYWLLSLDPSRAFHPVIVSVTQP